MVPEPPPAEMAPSCAEAGVLGVLPGIIGSIQAIETIKLLLGLGDPLIGRLLAYDSLEQSFREYKVRKDPANEITWENRDRITVAELDEHCMPHPLQPPARSRAGRRRGQRGAADGPTPPVERRGATRWRGALLLQLLAEQLPRAGARSSSAVSGGASAAVAAERRGRGRCRGRR